MYADELTDSMEKAIKETNRRRGIQEAYNKEHNIVPKTIKKSVRDSIRAIQTENIGIEYKLEKEEDIKESINNLNMLVKWNLKKLLKLEIKLKN